MKIEDTKSYRRLDKVAQLIVGKGSSKRSIKDAVSIAKNIGVEKWESITNIPNNWRDIVKELAAIK